VSKTLSIIEARDQLMKLSDEMARGPDLDAVTITTHGKPVMAVLSYDAYEALVETLSILSDSEMAEALRRGMADISDGRVQDLDDVLAELGW